MSNTVLDSVALAYQPVWNRRRRLAAVRLSVMPANRATVDAAHLLHVLGEHWPSSAPLLIIAPSTPDLLYQALHCGPVTNTWLEVPYVLFRQPEILGLLQHAHERGVQFLRRAELAQVRKETEPPMELHSLLHLTATEATETLLGLRSSLTERMYALPSNQIYENIVSREMADHCLDEAHAWGILGWPDEDVLRATDGKPPGCDPLVIAQIRRAVARDEAIDRIERLVRQDPELVYRLLVSVNSAVNSQRHEVDSIRHAIMMYGLSAFDRWLVGQLAGADDDLSLHPVRYGLVMRARLAQHLLDPGSDEQLRAEVYVTAIFAQLDRLMQEPLEELLERLPMSSRLTDALIEHTGPYHSLLAVSEALGNHQHVERVPAICEENETSLEQANRALLRMIASSRDHGLS